MRRVPIPVAVAMILNRGRVFMVRRPRTKPLAGQWEFPGGKIKVGESPELALRRELREELRVRVGALTLFGANAHVYNLPEGAVHFVLLAYRASARDGPWSKTGRWMDAPSLAVAAVVAGSRPFVTQLLSSRLVR